MDIREADDEDLLQELYNRGFKVSIKVLGVDVECYIGDKMFEVRAAEEPEKRYEEMMAQGLV